MGAVKFLLYISESQLPIVLAIHIDPYPSIASLCVFLHESDDSSAHEVRWLK